MKTLKVFLDTSVINFLFARDVPEKMLATEEVFRLIKEGHFEPVISTTVLAEIAKAPPQVKTLLENVVKDNNATIVEDTVDVVRLANKYVEAGIIPEKYKGDAMILASAVASGADILLSWNFEHIVKMKTKRGVNAVSLLEGYRTIEIYAPWEVIEREED